MFPCFGNKALKFCLCTFTSRSSSDELCGKASHQKCSEDHTAGAELLGSLPSLSLVRAVPTEVWLRHSRSDASNVSPSKNAATLFPQGHTYSVAFLRFYIYIVGFPHRSIGIAMGSVCFYGISGKFSF